MHIDFVMCNKGIGMSNKQTFHNLVRRLKRTSVNDDETCEKKLVTEF